MTFFTPLRILTMAAALFCLAALIFLIIRALSFGRRKYLSVPRGHAGRGIAYAFGRGILDKESVALHRPTFIGGVIYHSAIFTGLADLLWVVFLPEVRRPLWAFRAVFLAGIAVGLALLIKRASKPHLRRLSCPDDFFANLFVDLFLAVALLHTVFPALEPVLLSTAIVLFIYVPLGKIRHCFFFFFTRIAFSIHFGRRGALPGSSREA
jgi:hypothetical protein